VVKLGNSFEKLNIIIHDGREEPVELERMTEFEKYAYERFYEPGREYDTTRQIEKLGPVLIDFTNVHSWLKISLTSIHEAHDCSLFGLKMGKLMKLLE